MTSERGGGDSHPMTLMDHLKELRTRLFLVVAVFIAGSTLAYVYRDDIVRILLSPLQGQKLVYLNVAGGFNFIFLISIYVGIAVVVPLLIQQLYRFLQPVLPIKVQKYSVRIFFSSLILLCAGIAFGYVFAIPGALKFLYAFAGDYVEASLTADSYLSFIIAYTAGLGLVFQLPLVLLFIHWVKPLTPTGLLKSERWVILLSFVAAAIITPTPDPVNQTVIALPIIIIYQIGVVAVLISVKNTRRAQKRAQAATWMATPDLARVVPKTAPTEQPTPAPQPFVAPPTALVAVTEPPKSLRPQQRRTMDGMIKTKPSQRQVQPHMQIPARPPVTTSRPVPQRSTAPTRVQRLTIDGFFSAT